MVLTASQKIGAFVEALPAHQISREMVHQVARVFVDTFAVAVGGFNEPSSRIAQRYATADGSVGRSTLWCSRKRARPEDAALANAVMAHALDYDDVTYTLRGHPSVVLIPALVALGEAEDATGNRISAAYTCGFEVIIKLAQSMVWDHYFRGWHSTSTIGVIGAAAACANLLGLNAEKAAAAVGIACAHASGIRRSFGTMAKCIQPANAAASAVRAARLAAAGFTAPADSLEGGYGYVALYGNGEDLHPQVDRLGVEPLELLRTGVDAKKYPCCYATHRAIQAALQLRAESPLPPEEIERVRVRVHARGLVALIHKRPWTGTEGKFSMEYAIATALIDGSVGLNSFTDEAAQRPQLQELLPKVECFEEEGGPTSPQATVDVFTRGGESRTAHVETLRGSARMPLTDAELEEKLRDCAAYSGLSMDVDRFLSQVWNWGDLPIRSIVEASV